MKFTVRFAGYGGYGVVTASRVLGLAFAQKGYHVLQTESHGAAARGGACTADLIVSSDPIFELGFEKPNVLIVLSAPAYEKCCPTTVELCSDILIIETTVVDNPEVKKSFNSFQECWKKIYQVALRKIAEDLGHVRYIGVASLGVLADIDDRVDIKLLEQTIKTDSKLSRFKKENLKALHNGANAPSIDY